MDEKSKESSPSKWEEKSKNKNVEKKSQSIAVFNNENINIGGSIKVDFKHVNFALVPNITDPVKHFQLIENPTPYFAGREDLINKIYLSLIKCTKFESYHERIVVIHGIGGIGKSEVAREFVRNKICKKSHPVIKNVAWIDSETDTSLKSSFERLSRKLKLPWENVEADEMARNVYEHYAKHCDLGLFIFDNVEQLENKASYFGILDYLPTQQGLIKRPLILITSRTNQWKVPANEKNIIELSELSDEASVTLLKKQLRLTEAQAENEDVLRELGRLARCLQGYPLGLSLAASNIRPMNRDPADVAKEVKDYITKLDVPNGGWIDDGLSIGSASKYKKMMKNVWKVTLDKIEDTEKEGECALILLNLMAFLAPDSINVKKVEDIVKKRFTALTKDNDEKCRYALCILQDYSLISLIDDKRIRIHRHVQRCTREYLDGEKDNSFLLENCRYFINYKILSMTSEDEVLVLHRFLRERKWPKLSLLFSVIFFSRCTNMHKTWKEIAQDVNEKLWRPDWEQVNQLLTLCNMYFSIDDRFKGKYECEREATQQHAVGTAVRAFLNVYRSDAYVESFPGIVEFNMIRLWCQAGHEIYRNASHATREMIKKTVSETASKLECVTEETESISRLYKMLSTCYTCKEDPDCFKMLIKSISKHSLYNSYKDRVTIEQLTSYWNPGPIHIAKIYEIFEEPDEQWRNGIVDAFWTAEHAPDVLTDRLCFAASTINFFQPWHPSQAIIAYLLELIPYLATSLERAEAFAKTPNFLDTFNIFTSLTDISAVTSFIPCLLAWMALFQFGPTLRDLSGNEWTIETQIKTIESNFDFSENRFTCEISPSWVKKKHIRLILTHFAEASVCEKESWVCRAAIELLKIGEAEPNFQRRHDGLALYTPPEVEDPYL